MPGYADYTDLQGGGRSVRKEPGSAAAEICRMMFLTAVLSVLAAAAAAQSTGGSRMEIFSPSFADNQRIPKEFTGEGADISPEIQWGTPPPGAREFALICDDPDAPVPEPWVHWVIYGIPAGTSSLRQGIPGDPSLMEPHGALQGKNSWGTTGYRGPMPPPGHGTHRYFFKLYVLDNRLNLKPGADKKEVLAAMKGHVLAETGFVGTYSR